VGAPVVSKDRTTPDAGFVKSEIRKWEAPIKASGVKVQQARSTAPGRKQPENSASA
jgi:hypothetical protein